MKLINSRYIALAIGLAGGLCSMAAPASHYARNSALSEGKWVKVAVSETGMQLITDAQLRTFGFTDPSKVHVYGTGGYYSGFSLGAGVADDLPLQPSVRTSKGLVFFGTDQFTWKSSKTDPSVPYSHVIHPYSDENYYFLSDRAVDDAEIAAAETTALASGEGVTTYVARLVHEEELEHAGESGSLILGEDFRSKNNQTFGFKLPGLAEDRATVRVQFGAKTTSGTSRLSFKANGEALPELDSDVIGQARVEDFITLGKFVRDIDSPGESLDFNISYTSSGTLFKARLDYIEVFYSRSLDVSGGELHFYGDFEGGQPFEIKGCDESTVIWDVTDVASPKQVEYTLTGTTAVFAPLVSGYKEYVAFNPSVVSRQVKSAGAVANQDIHSMSVPDMVIITLPQYAEGANRLAALHEKEDGMRVAVINAEDAYNEFSSGKRDFNAFRKMLKMWYDRGLEQGGIHQLRYCILMGKPSYDNKMVSSAIKAAGYTPMPIYQSTESIRETTSYSNDDLIGMLDDADDATFRIEKAKLHVAVGRFPVTSSEQAVQMAEKVEKYVTNPDYGPWRARVMIIADDDDNAQHLDQAQRVYAKMRSAGNGESIVYDRLYLDSYERVYTSVGATYPQATERMIRNYDDGVMYTDYIGHASATGWGHEHLWEWKDINSMTNSNLTFIYAATCGFAYWDLPEYSGAEVILLNPDAGVIGMMAASRTVYIDRNGVLNENIHKYLFEKDENGKSLRFGDVYLKGKNDYLGVDNNLRYAFLGDPAIKVPSPDNVVSFSTINGVDVDSDADAPEIPAQGRVTVEGVVRDASGNVYTDFNGTVNLQLYDAEKVITTYGQGSSGQVRVYNDRTSRLTQTNAEVRNGHWKATLQLPPEIEGNYSPAMISAYAWNGKGLEANGLTEHLYVYGYDEDRAEDVTPPTIEKFYVNNELIPEGSVVSRNPIVFARLSDESGINLSENSIGHSITLSVDDATYYGDLNNYFTPETDDPCAGSIVYPLSDITPGRHKLTLTVWDNANNVSKSTIDINVGATVDPVIYDITTNFSVASDGVTFTVVLDRPNTKVTCNIGVYDLLGRKVWSNEQTVNTNLQSSISAHWDLCDGGGNRVPRGIYIYKASVETPEGTQSTKSKKLAVSAQ